MANKALVDISNEQTSVASADLLFVESGGTPAKITAENAFGGPFAFPVEVENGSGQNPTLNTNGTILGQNLRAVGGQLFSDTDTNPAVYYRNLAGTLQLLGFFNSSARTFDVTLYDSDGTNGRLVGRFEDEGTTVSSTQAVITAEKGDTRYEASRSSQTWQDVSGGYTAGDSVQNTEGQPIEVAAVWGGGTYLFQVSSDNSTWVDVGRSLSGTNEGQYQGTIPTGHYYRIETGATVTILAELK